MIRVSHNVRDTVLFVAGIAGVAYETLFEHIDRPQLLILFAAMLGLPAMLRADTARRERNDDEERPPRRRR